tara:strand:+ start:2093 stop:2929 length:837 start_codon:yes stop_codon:yes gene_type:complete
MDLNEAYNYMDMLLDKADQPYFTINEKNRFLDLAISDFINSHYQRMGADEDSRKALTPIIDYARFTLTASEIISESYIHNNNYPALSKKYTEDEHLNRSNDMHDVGTQKDVGYFIYGNQYLMPERHLYTITCHVSTYNYDQIIDPSTGKPYSGVTEDDVKISGLINVDLQATADFHDQAESKDPFNGFKYRKSEANTPEIRAHYVENRIVFTNPKYIRQVIMHVIFLPTFTNIFYYKGEGDSNLPKRPTLSEHHQRQIIELAVSKMTQVDVGLMTGPS